MRFLLVFVCFIGHLAFSQEKKVEFPTLEVSWNLLSNFADNGGHEAEWVIHNQSAIDLTDENWALYWNMAPREIIEASVAVPVTMRWIDGDFYEMKPDEGFFLSGGESLHIKYRGEDAMIKETDAPLGVYLTYLVQGEEKLIPIPIPNYTILPFVGQEQINRGPGDREPIPTAQWLFEQNQHQADIDIKDLPLLLPSPKIVKQNDGMAKFTNGISIHYEEELLMEAQQLAFQLEDFLNTPINLQESTQEGPNIITLLLDSVVGEEQYTLDIKPESIVIKGRAAGVFYGTQSLLALLPVEQFQANNTELTFPLVHIEDEPAFGYRGMHLDVARNFNSLETVKRLLDVMAFYKLNKLQLRLTEDEGWRLEIEELPELTGFGAVRGHTLKESEFLHPSYGSGPIPNPQSGYGSGFFSREEYIDLVQYARRRHIEIIPEICVPTHARAAIKAMEARYQRLMKEGKTEDAEQFRLIDPEDQSEYRSAQWYTENTICVCRESAYDFFTTVIDDIIEMHQEAGVPLRTLHTGGDELPDGAWSESPICEDYMHDSDGIQQTKDLQLHFFERIHEFLVNAGISTAGWEEVAQMYTEDGKKIINGEFAHSTVVPYVWNSLWGDEDLGNRLANAGYPVVLCNVTNFYFDLAYNKDPREPGLYWAGFVDTRDAFDFVPYDIFQSIKVNADGHQYNPDYFTALESLTPEGRRNILGMQGQLWSETIKGRSMLEYYYLPKMLGLAERAWSGQPAWASGTDIDARRKENQKAWNIFVNELGKRELPRLDKFEGGYNYRLPSPGASIIEGHVNANSSIPGLIIRYTIDGSTPDLNSPKYDEPFLANAEQIKLSTFDQRGRASLPTTLILK